MPKRMCPAGRRNRLHLRLRDCAAASFRNELRSMIGPGGEDGLRSDFAK
ncbi:hypothetical protein C7S17_5265 [Burkholderia thailandensis]|nr:hypothetical protein [Burkholderia thailandensis]